MKYMLDTNICIYTIKQKPEAVIKNFLKYDPEANLSDVSAIVKEKV